MALRYKKAQVGDKLRIPASFYNAVIDHLQSNQIDITAAPKPKGISGGVGISVRRAVTTESAGNCQTITANLYNIDGTEQTSGDESGITVYCTIIGRAKLNAALPRLAIDTEIYVAKFTYKPLEWVADFNYFKNDMIKKGVANEPVWNSYNHKYDKNDLIYIVITGDEKKIYKCLQTHYSAVTNKPGTSGGAGYWKEISRYLCLQNHISDSTNKPGISGSEVYWKEIDSTVRWHCISAIFQSSQQCGCAIV
jgi:hypothetical protein